MTELEELGEIADQCAIGRELSLRNPARGGRPFLPRCGSPDHMQPPNIRRYTDGKGRKRTVCTLCDKARRKAKHPTYNLQGYPL